MPSPMRLFVTLALVLAPLTLGCSGPSEKQDPDPTGGMVDEAQPDPDASTATEADKTDARMAAASAGPVGGEATKTGAAPKESKLTNQDKFDINAVIKEHRHELTDCFDEPLSTIQLPADGFVIKAGFTIEADGRVSGARVVEATERFAEAEECFLLGLAMIRFPEPPEGRVIEATYPFTIKRK